MHGTTPEEISFKSLLQFVCFVSFFSFFLFVFLFFSFLFFFFGLDNAKKYDRLMTHILVCGLSTVMLTTQVPGLPLTTFRLIA